MAGTIYRHGDHWDVRLTLPGGKKARPVHLPPDVDEETARTTADAMHRRAREKLAAARAPIPAQSCDGYAARLFAHRRAHGYTSVRQDESRWRKWASPELGSLDIAAVGPDDTERVVRRLDGAVHAKEILAKTASLAWGVVTSLFAETCESKVPELRVRPRGDNPCNGVRGPDADAGRICGWIYPVEAFQLFACDRVPLRWRRLIALSIYLYLRPGELEALELSAIDRVAWTASVHLAADRSKERGATKKTKTHLVRSVPIEPAIRPLVETLLAEARREGRRTLVTMPPVSDLAAGLRTYLLRAGVDREALHADDESRRQIRFYDLRATGITWRALRGDLPLAIQRAAGHESLDTTQDYIRAASDVGRGVGEPFPALPTALFGLDSLRDRPQVPGLETRRNKAFEEASPAGFEPHANGGECWTSTPNPRIGTPFGFMGEGGAHLLSEALSRRLSGGAPKDLLERACDAATRAVLALAGGEGEVARSSALELAELCRFGGRRRRGAPRYITHPETGETFTVSEWARRLGRTSQALTDALDRRGPVALLKKGRAA